MLHINLKYIRKELGKTQEEMGLLLFCERSTVDKWENGHRTPSLRAIDQIIKLSGMEITLNDLLHTDLSLRQKVA